ncbi:MAG: hypothetical protein EHM18_15410 [Acidobacteria bacterium]|nr:MAG: hypothetical protein EHM18_15410 [Acidobacteriota bacterium]
MKRAGDNGESLIAELVVVSGASTSAVCEIKPVSGELQVGDTARLAPEVVEELKTRRAAADSLKYPQVVSFTEEDPLEAELREYVPRPPLQEINRARGRIGFEYNGIRDHSSSVGSSQLGLVLRADVTRLGGSYWNFNGYYRGRVHSRNRSGNETLTDLINRTYQLGLTYNRPGSSWVAGLGRLYVPWASSLNTIDGGYFGRRIGKSFTTGLFGGSSPDPTSWRYAPDRQLLGAFVNYEGGTFESFRHTNTVGLALNRINWDPDRQFAFFENGFFYKQIVSVYHNLEVDYLRAGLDPETKGLEASRSFLTVRVQPVSRISFDVNHNYFKDIPTFDSQLIGTGLLDRYLFQGTSAGMRVDLPYRITPYVSIGRSSRSGDDERSWNQMYGVTIGEIMNTGIRLDTRFSEFNSSFADGSYQSLSISRELGERLRLDLQAGRQNFASRLTGANSAHWVTLQADWFLGRHYFLGSGVTVYRGSIQDYDQWMLNLGYRF